MRLLVRLLAVTLLLFVSAALARAQTFAGVDLLNSTIFQQHQSSFSGLGARVKLHSAALAPGFELLPSLEYWRSSMKIETFDITTVRKDVTLGVDARYSFRGASWKPYIGAGFGAHFLSSEVDAPDMGLHHAKDTVIKGGLSAMAGMSFPITARLGNFVEVKYHHLPGYSQLKINMGIGWAF
jgi:hypothetical protein